MEATAQRPLPHLEYHRLIAQYGLQDLQHMHDDHQDQGRLGEESNQREQRRMDTDRDEELALRLQAELFREFLEQYEQQDNNELVDFVDDAATGGPIRAHVVVPEPTEVIEVFRQQVDHIVMEVPHGMSRFAAQVLDNDMEDDEHIYEELLGEIPYLGEEEIEQLEQMDQQEAAQARVNLSGPDELEETLEATALLRTEGVHNQILPIPDSESIEDIPSVIINDGPTEETFAVSEARDRSHVASPFPTMCAICLSAIHYTTSALLAPCGDQYCQTCLLGFIRTCCSSLGNSRSLEADQGSSFPPRCCGIEIPAPSMFVFLDDEMRDTLREAMRIHDTPPGQRVYCSNSACSHFLGGFEDQDPDATNSSISSTGTHLVTINQSSPASSSRSNVGAPLRTNVVNTIPSTRSISCSRCSSETCLTCKGPAHDAASASPCPVLVSRKHTRALDDLASSRHWRKCSECKVYVQLNGGCNHVTCRCGHQFCYVCGTRWKTCRCLQWEERNIIDNDEADADPGDEVVIVEEAIMARVG